MKRYFTYRSALLLSTFLLLGSLSACSSGPDSPAINNVNSAYILNNDDNIAPDSPSPTTLPEKEEPETDITKAETLPPNTLVENEMTLNVRGKALTIGESIDEVIDRLGHPYRIDETEYNYDYYIYNNDYSKLLFIAVTDGEVVGFYTDSLDFNYNGIKSGSDLDAVRNILGISNSIEEVLKKTTEDLTIHVLMDKLQTQTVTGVYVLTNSVKLNEYTKEVTRNIELEVYDLTNSIRIRNDLSVLSWSSSAALSSRKHSVDMADKNYFNHVNLEYKKPGDRMRSEGISYKTCGENIIAGYGAAILSTHGWFNSTEHREILLNKNFRYLGVGFTYKEDSTYKTYITQNFYR